MPDGRGFTLVECAVALSVFVLALTMTLPVGALALRLHEDALRMSLAAMAAQGRVEALSTGGWEAAVVRCSERHDHGGWEEPCRIREERKGRPFVLLLEKAAADGALSAYRVSCRWRDGKGRRREQNVFTVPAARAQPW